MFNLTQFQPAHRFLVEFLLQQRQSLALLRQFLHRECPTTQGLFYPLLLLLEGSNIFLQLLKLALLLIGEFSSSG